MDPVTTAIIAAITAGMVSAASDIGKQSVADVYSAGKQAITDSYNGLKALLKRKFGEQSEVMKSVESLEAEPELNFKKEALKHYLTKAKANEDEELKKAAEDLLALIKKLPQGEQLVQTTQTAIGSNIAQAAGGSTATVTVNKPEK